MKAALLRLATALTLGVAIAKGLPAALRPILAPQDPTVPTWLRLSMLPLLLLLAGLVGVTCAEVEWRLRAFQGRRSATPNETKMSYRRSWQPACCEASGMDDSGAG